MNDKKYLITFQETRAVSREFIGKSRDDVERKARAWIEASKAQAPWKPQAVLIKNVKLQGIK